jgi:hypothetical protein
MCEIDLDKFIKIIGLFGSAHEGERANAAALATKMLRDAGLTWVEFFNLLAAPPPVPRSPAPTPNHYQTFVDHKDAVEQCLMNGRNLTRWERLFIESLQDFPYLSVKQKAVFDRICRKCGVEWPR